MTGEKTDSIEEMIRKIKNLDENVLLSKLKKFKLFLGDDNFHTAFSCYGIAKLISRLDYNSLRNGMDHNRIPDEGLEAIRTAAEVVYKAYTAFIFMRNRDIEKHLKGEHENSILRSYRELFVKIKSEDPVGQRIRNAFAHGNFKFTKDLKEIALCDYDPKTYDNYWCLRLSVRQLLQICDQVFRFYGLVFEATYHP